MLGLQLTVINEFLFSTLIVDCLFFIYVYLCTSANIDVQIFLNYYANATVGHFRSYTFLLLANCYIMSNYKSLMPAVR